VTITGTTGNSHSSVTVVYMMMCGDYNYR